MVKLLTSYKAQAIFWAVWVPVLIASFWGLDGLMIAGAVLGLVALLVAVIAALGWANERTGGMVGWLFLIWSL